MLRAVRIAIALVLMMFVAAGCAYGEIRPVLRADFASDLRCADVRVENKGLAYVTETSKTQRYRVTGRGAERTYTCPRDAGLVSYDKPPCTWVEGDPDQPKAATAHPGTEDPFAEQASDAAGEAPPAVEPSPAATESAPAEPAP